MRGRDFHVVGGRALPVLLLTRLNWFLLPPGGQKILNFQV